MTLSRRAIVLAPAAFAVASPQTPVRLDPVLPGLAILRLGQMDAGLVVPSDRAALVGRFTLADHDLVAVAFAADISDAARIDLVALVAIQAGATARLVGLEMFSFLARDGRTLSTRMSAPADGSKLGLARAAAMPHTPTLITRAAWIDYLSWNGGEPLADSPVHPPPPQSWAAELALRRMRVRIALMAPVAAITPALLDDTHLARMLSP